MVPGYNPEHMLAQHLDLKFDLEWLLPRQFVVCYLRCLQFWLHNYVNILRVK